MTVHYELTARDLDAFLRYWERNSPLLRKRRALYRWGAVAVWLGVALLLSILERNLAPLFIFAVISAAWIPLAPRVFHGRFLRDTKRLLEESPKGGFIGSHSLTLSSEGLVAASNAVEARLAWSSVHAIRVFEDRLFIDLGTLRSLVVPENQFEDSGAFCQFLEKAREMRERTIGLLPARPSTDEARAAASEQSPDTSAAPTPHNGP